MDLGGRIRTLREKKHLKQVDLANALQISPQAVSKWEKNENAPDLVSLPRLAKLLGVTIDELLGMNNIENGVFEATVFCSSISGFAKGALVAGSKEVADRTNVIFHHLTEVALKYGGVPIKYVGDGFLCFFSGVAHADRALEAARHAKRSLTDRSIAISLNSGDIYLGSIGHPEYASRDICGDTVNRAFLISERIADICKSGIGLTESVRNKLEKKNSLTPPKQVFVRHLRTRLAVYEPRLNKKEQ